jgi:hypothetical protein
MRRDAARALARDQRLDRLLRRRDARKIGAARDVRCEHVVPRAHRVAVVDRHRPDRRVREQEPDRQAGGQVELGHDRDEIVAVGTEAVQPDDAGARVGCGLEFDVR